MDKDDFALLNYLIKTENVSVMYFPHGKLYVIPANSIIDFLSPEQSGDSDYYQFIHCVYSLQVGIPFLTCDISLGSTADTAQTIEHTSIRLNAKKYGTHQRMILSTIENCAKKLIIQEKAHQKYAMETAITSFTSTKEYN